MARSNSSVLTCVANALRSDSTTTIGHPTVSKYVFTSPIAVPSPPRLQHKAVIVQEFRVCNGFGVTTHASSVAPDVVVDPGAPVCAGQPEALESPVERRAVDGVMHVTDDGVGFQHHAERGV